MSQPVGRRLLAGQLNYTGEFGAPMPARPGPASPRIAALLLATIVVMVLLGASGIPAFASPAISPPVATDGFSVLAGGAGPEAHFSTNPFVTLPSVNETYVALNGTLVRGNFLPGNYPDTWSLAANPAANLAYAVGTNRALTTAAVSILNLSKDQVVGTIPIAAGWPFADYYAAASNQLFVAQEGLGQVTVVN